MNDNEKINTEQNTQNNLSTENKKPLSVKVDNIAVLKCFDENDNEVFVKRCYRNIFYILHALKSFTEDEKAKAKKIKIITNAVDIETNNNIELYIDQGTYDDLIKQCEDMIISPNEIMEELKNICEIAASRSLLKAIFISMVFDDAKLAGFAYLSGSLNVTNDDIITLVEGAKNQIAMFKDNIKKHKPDIKFLDDSPIIIPSSYKM